MGPTRVSAPAGCLARNYRVRVCTSELKEHSITDMNPENRRKNKRVRAPKGTLAGWKSPGQSSVSRVYNIGLGGAYLTSPNPPATGSSIELVLSLPIGEVRARAVVRRSTPGRGMGLQFIQMRPEDRAKLNQFLSQATENTSDVCPVVAPQQQVEQLNQPASPIDQSFQQELTKLTDLARKGNYYQLLGVGHDSPSGEIKRKYYTLAKKYHPDLHMDKRQAAGSLKEFMEKITEAYQILRDEQKRNAYDLKLATTGAFNLGRSKTESQETVEECVSRAQEYLRARNVVGSITWLRKCVDLMPDSGKHHAMLARSLGTVLAYKDEAIFHFEKAIELDPLNTEAYFYFGELYEALKLPWRAQPLYAKILEINPEHAKAREKFPLASSKEKRGTSSR
jgi:tetratricopeptide (TPR) repeat protein